MLRNTNVPIGAVPRTSGDLLRLFGDPRIFGHMEPGVSVRTSENGYKDLFIMGSCPIV